MNNNDLLEIREQLASQNSIVTDPNTLATKRILLVGNTGYITEKFIEDTFENNNILIAGETHLKTAGRVKVYNGKKIPYERIFETYDFDVVIFFARELTYSSKENPDTEMLREILNHTAKYQKNAKVIYFSSLDGAYSNKKDISVITLSKENLCEFYTKHFGVDVKIVRIPHLYSGILEGDFLNRIFEDMGKGTVTLREAEGSRAYFISMHDVSGLVARFLENWQEGIGTLNVSDEFNVTFGDVMRHISKLNPSLRVRYTGENEGALLEIKNTALRNEYGWFSRISIMDDIEEEYEKYLLLKSLKTTDFRSKVKKWISEHALLVKILEIALMFIITELLNLATGSSVMFSIVDYDREPWIADAGTVRITFDMDVRAAVGSFDIFDATLPTLPVLEPGKCVMEVKFTEFLPQGVREILPDRGSEFTAVSKYVLCYEKTEYMNAFTKYWYDN